MFISGDQVNQQGVYNVKLYKNGLPLTIMIDDKLPSTTNSSLVFAKAVDNVFWPALLEKAYAKIHGSYESIKSGHSSEVLRDLTGAPTFTHKTDEDNLFARIKEAANNGFLMTAGGIELKESWFKKNILRIDEQKKMDDLGIVPSHAYGLIDAVEVIDKYKRRVQLLNLRNPWGSFEWKGPWGRDCPNWTDDLK